MSILQKAKSCWSATVESKWLIGRRLVLSFKNATNPKVLVLKVPATDELSFSVEESLENGRARFALKMASGTESAKDLAYFQTQAEALSALGMIRRKFGWGPRKIVKTIAWTVLAVMVLSTMLNWIGSAVFSKLAGQPASPQADYRVAPPPVASGDANQILRQMLDASAKQSAEQAAAAQAPSALPEESQPAEAADAASVLNALKAAK